MTTILAINGDWHVNDTNGLCPPQFRRERDAVHRPDKFQRAIWSGWLEYWEVVARYKEDLGAPVIGVYNGDLGDINYHSKDQLISPLKKDIQQAMADVAKLGHIGDGGHVSNPYPSARNSDDSEFNNTRQDRNNTIYNANWAGGDFWSWFGTTPTGGYETFNINSSEKSHLFVRKHHGGGHAGESILRGDTQAALPCTFYSFVNVMGSAPGSGDYMSFGVMFSDGSWRELRLTDAAANMTITAVDNGGVAATLNLVDKVQAAKLGLFLFDSGGNLYVRSYAELAGRSYYHSYFDPGSFHQWGLGATAGRTLAYIYLKFGDVNFANFMVDSVRKTFG